MCRMTRRWSPSGLALPWSSLINRFAWLLLLGTGGFAAGCTWVDLTPSGEAVRVVPADRVADCRRVGTLSVYTKAEVAGIDRSADKVRGELETLARNEAATMHADTIVADSEIAKGRRDYVAYRCR